MEIAQLVGTEEAMVAWRDDLLSLAHSEGSEAEVFEGVANLVRGLGFDYCAYGLQMPVPVSAPKVFMVNTYSDQWRERYSRNDYLSIDPTVQHGHSSLQPLTWNAACGGQHSEFWEDAKAHNIAYGWCQSSFTRTGIGGLLTLSRSHEAISTSEIIQKGIQFHWLVHITHEAMAHRQVKRMNASYPLKLSDRETEVLRWTADGKSAQEIADILNVTKHTVEFHIKNAVNKLQAVNKTAAVVKALVLGLLW